jgi:hypothetical protein
MTTASVFFGGAQLLFALPTHGGQKCLRSQAFSRCFVFSLSGAQRVGANLRICRSNIQSGINGLRVSESEDRTQRQQRGARRDHEQKARLRQGPNLGEHQFPLFGCLHLGRPCRGRIQKISSELLPTSSGQSCRAAESHQRGNRKVFQLGTAEPSARSRPGHLPPVCRFIRTIQAMIEGLAASGN